jgi:hypothetical protein
MSTRLRTIKLCSNRTHPIALKNLQLKQMFIYKQNSDSGMNTKLTIQGDNQLCRENKGQEKLPSV